MSEMPWGWKYREIQGLKPIVSSFLLVKIKGQAERYAKNLPKERCRFDWCREDGVAVSFFYRAKNPCGRGHLILS